MRGFGQIAARGGDLSAGRRVPVPLCSRWRDATPFTAVACPPDDGGDARRRARTAHTARQAERARPEAGRQTAFSRWPRTQPRRGPRPQLSRPSLGGRGHSCFLPPLTEIFRIAARQRHGEKRGVVRGEKNTAGAATRTRPGGRRNTNRLETADASGRRRAAAAPEGRKGHAPARHEDARESAASGQADQTDDGEAASGRGSNCPPPRAPETARPRQRTAKRRRGGRRRRRPGGTRARLLAAPLCHQRRAPH